MILNELSIKPIRATLLLALDFTAERILTIWANSSALSVKYSSVTGFPTTNGTVAFMSRRYTSSYIYTFSYSSSMMTRRRVKNPVAWELSIFHLNYTCPCIGKRVLTQDPRRRLTTNNPNKRTAIRVFTAQNCSRANPPQVLASNRPPRRSTLHPSPSLPRKPRSSSTRNRRHDASAPLTASTEAPQISLAA